MPPPNAASAPLAAGPSPALPFAVSADSDVFQWFSSCSTCVDSNAPYNDQLSRSIVDNCLSKLPDNCTATIQGISTVNVESACQTSEALLVPLRVPGEGWLPLKMDIGYGTITTKSPSVGKIAIGTINDKCTFTELMDITNEIHWALFWTQHFLKLDPLPMMLDFSGKTLQVTMPGAQDSYLTSATIYTAMATKVAEKSASSRTFTGVFGWGFWLVLLVEARAALSFFH